MTEPYVEVIADRNGDELENGEPDFPGQFDPVDRVDEAWAALVQDVEGQSYPYHEATIARHRPLIEAALRRAGTGEWDEASLSYVGLAETPPEPRDPDMCPCCDGTGVGVERLTTALYNVDQGNEFDTLDDARDYAKELVREYAALAAPLPEETL